MSLTSSVAALFAKFPLSDVVSWLPTIARVVSRGVSINAIEDDLQEPKIQAEIPGADKIVSFLQQLGLLHFSKVAPDLQAAAGAAMVTKDYAIKVQKLINQVAPPSPVLDVDGAYGPLTRKAVLAYQTLKGLTPDEFAGDKTLAALMADATAMNALPTPAAASAPAAAPAA